MYNINKILNSKFITIEGGDGAGKSTQIKKIKLFLESRGIETCLTREPGGNIKSEEIRKLLVNKRISFWDGSTEYLLLSAARRHHLLHTIWPALVQGKWVICDRFYDSSIAYQGYGHNISLLFLNTIYYYIAKDFIPNLTFIMNVNSANGIERTKLRNHSQEDHYESMNLIFHKRLIEGYKDLVKNNPSRFVVIDANQSLDIVWIYIRSIIEERLFYE